MSEQILIKLLTIVEVVETPSWVGFVIDDQGSSKAITILCMQMRVIPSSKVIKQTENVSGIWHTKMFQTVGPRRNHIQRHVRW
jgi:hypothetical protein